MPPAPRCPPTRAEERRTGQNKQHGFHLPLVQVVQACFLIKKRATFLFSLPRTGNRSCFSILILCEDRKKTSGGMPGPKSGTRYTRFQETRRLIRLGGARFRPDASIVTSRCFAWELHIIQGCSAKSTTGSTQMLPKRVATGY